MSDDAPQAGTPRSAPPIELIMAGLGVVGVLVVVLILVIGRGGDDSVASDGGAVAEDATNRTEPPVTVRRDTTATTSTTVADATSADPAPTSTTTTTPATTTPTTTTTTVPPTTTTTVAPTTTLPPDPEVVAGTTLTALLAEDAPTMPTLEEKWVPQLSAKRLGLEWEGVTYDYQAILAEHRALREQYGAILVDGATYSFRANDAPMAGWFITLVPEAYGSPDGALGWCTAMRIGRDDCFAKLITNRPNPGQTIQLND